MKNVDISNIIFIDDLQQIKNENTFVVTIPKNIKSKDHLMDIYSEKLKLPGYFGHNWDALDEVLHDLCWIDQRTIIINHEDIPSGLNNNDLKIYLDTLLYAVQVWKDSPRAGFEPPDIMHEFIVVFPLGSRKTVKKILESNNE